MPKRTAKQDQTQPTKQHQHKKWTEEEQTIFKRLYKLHRTKFDMYVPYFNDRSESQIRSFYYNVLYYNKLRSSDSNLSTPTNINSNRTENGKTETKYVFNVFAQLSENESEITQNGE
ncbi:SANT/Myb_domain [Hexamita inflata]|uniref:SANT/Myb domain n=1 Tax=Hexamita inflata TaxID=28002 RepID=A0AA86QGI3_9EUKA|nr:SANT/Myb domain [Hexamita inflata]